MYKNLLLILTMWWLGCSIPKLFSQQFPISTIQILRTGAYNPGHSTAGELHELTMDVKQGISEIVGWRTASQYLRYTNRPVGRNRSFCWGFMASRWDVHTENILLMGPTVNAILMEEPGKKLSIGMGIGIMNWSSDYGQSANPNPEDPVFVSGSNFTEIDASVGAEFNLRRDQFHLDAGVTANHLTGNLLTDQLPGFRLIPHLRGNATAFYHLNSDIHIGPRIFFRNTFNAENKKLIAATTDLGLAVELPRKHMWAALAYRIDSSALTGGFGIPLIRSDTGAYPLAFANFLDLRFSATYPLAASYIGPAIEVGIAWKFGKKRIPKVDTMRNAGTFWKSQSYLAKHKEIFLDANGPENLEGSTEIQGKKVYLKYEFPDMSTRYVGDVPKPTADSLLYRIGIEWSGMDAFMENIPAEIIREALSPDSTNVRDPENLEALAKLSWIELVADLRADEYRIHFASGQEYIGELGFNNENNDSLNIRVVFDAKDTTISIGERQMMTYLELATLKLHVLRKKLEFELDAQMGEDYRVVWEESLDHRGLDKEDDFDDRLPLYIRKIRVNSNNPHMQVPQQTVVNLKFLRYPYNVPQDASEINQKKLHKGNTAADRERNLEE